MNSVPFCQISKILTSAVIERHVRDTVLSAVCAQFLELRVLLLTIMLLSHCTDEGTAEDRLNILPNVTQLEVSEART